ncbi:MAG: IclR family transcriptional regulator [Anaerolineae bacterium]|jgi:DNA-binding IclR family transcriptional regulator|nr:IclR family transcriptional regulator [Anaerolineae bacterium]
MDSEEKISPTLKHMTAILDCFSINRPELGVRETARQTGLPSSTVGRIMVAMKELRLLNQNPLTKSYSMGIRLLEWGGVFSASLDVRLKALPVLQELQRASQESISLYIYDGADRVCVERLESHQTVRIVTRVGRRLPLYAGSAGKAILAFLPEDRQHEIMDMRPLEPLTPNTITDAAQLRADLERVRRLGYAVSHGEWILEASGVAAPIFGFNDEVIGAVTISGPSQRFTPDKVAEYAPMVLAGAQQISIQMGHHPDLRSSL